MVVLCAQMTFHLYDSQSLKDKRRISRSLIDGARHKFNVAIAQVDTQDKHQLLTIGVAVVSGERRHASDMLEAVIRYLEENAQTDSVQVQRYE